MISGQAIGLKKLAVPKTSNSLAVGGPGGRRISPSALPRSSADIWVSQYAWWQWSDRSSSGRIQTKPVP